MVFEKETEHKDDGKTSGQKQRARGKPSDWDLESPFDTVISLEELVNMTPFKEASDSKGGTATIGTRIPIWLERKIIHLLEIRGTPYRLKSDVARDALYLGLRILNMRYKSNPDWAVESRMAKTIDRANLITRIKSQIEQIQRPLNELWSEGDEDQATALFEEFIGSSVEIEEEWHRVKLLQLVKSDRLLREIAEHCSPEVKKAVFGDRR